MQNALSAATQKPIGGSVSFVGVMKVKFASSAVQSARELGGSTIKKADIIKE